MFIQTVFRVELDLQAVHTAVLLRVEDSFEACISQTHAVLVLLRPVPVRNDLFAWHCLAIIPTAKQQSIGSN
jgi:hypothetical protein